MPIVAIDLTEEEASKLDAIADAEKRSRKAQAHIILIDGMERVETPVEPELQASLEN